MTHTRSYLMWSLAVSASTLLSLFASASTLESDFNNPGNEARPRAYWNWLNGAVTHEGLTRDLEEAKAKSLGGLEIWDCEAMRNANGFVPAGPPFLGPESLAAIQHSFKEAERLDLVVGMITSSGWNAGGPWVPPVYASKNLYFSETIIEGAGLVQEALPFPNVPEACPRKEVGSPQWSLEVAVLAWPAQDNRVIPDADEIVNLSAYVRNGVLYWEAPSGKWKVVRFVCTNNGQQLIAASPNSKGPFIDFLDPEATRFHFEYIIDKLGLKKGGDPHPLEYLEVDSMELHEGIQWSSKFQAWFTEQHGYDPISWLPVLAGWTIKDEPTSDRFLYDYQKSVSDLLIFSHYTTGREICHEYGLKLVAEAGGPGPPIWNSCPVDSLKALGQVDVPRGEFWVKNRHNIFLIKEIASAANIYGKPFVDAEAWTTWRRWKDSPFARKRWLDRAFCEGLNRVTYHVFSNSPEDAGRPGRNYHAGMDMNPQTVWWSKARPFMDYIARCCRMLQEGLFVADVAYYYGDQAPNFWPMHHHAPRKILLPGLGEGYDYDVVNSDVILNRMSVKDGRIVLPNGMSYRVLVLPEQHDKTSNDKTMSLEVLEKIRDLVAAGATVIGPKPQRVPGLHDYPARTAKLRKIADELWGAEDGISAQVHAYGKGRIVTGMHARKWLQTQSIGPDFQALDPGVLDYIHRRSEDREIYFVRNRAETSFSGRVAFRVSGLSAQLWDPACGTVRPAWAKAPGSGVTEVALNLAPGGSIFVVFSNAEKNKQTPGLVIGDASALELLESGSDRARVLAWKNGNYVIEQAAGEHRCLEVNRLPDPVPVEGSWTVHFDPEWGAPEQAEFPALVSWTHQEEAGIRDYSCAGFYTKELEMDPDWLKPGQSIFLDLGDVREIAEVFINGQSAGILWKAPFRAEITEHLRPGKNELKIEVMNLWINRLVADGKLPEAERLTQTNIRSGQDWEAQPAGLLGPVHLTFAQEHSVD